MKQHINVGKLDRGIRLLLALISIYYYLTPTVIGLGGLALLGAGVALLLTGIKGICPVYSLIRIRTIR